MFLKLEIIVCKNSVLHPDTSEHPYKGPGDMKCMSSTSEAFGRAGAGELASAGISLGLNWQAARTAHLF